MKLHLTPLMVALLAATAPIYPSYVGAAELGQVTVSDPSGQTQLTLDSGSTVTYASTGAALSVSVAGNSLTADNLVINAGSASAKTTKGVSATAGGVVNLSNSSVNTLGAGQNAYALQANGDGSVITASNTEITTAGQYSNGADAQAGGKIFLEGGSITTAMGTSYGVQANGENSLVSAKSMVIETSATGLLNYAAYALNGGSVELQDVTTLGGALVAQGLNSKLALVNTTVIAPNSAGITVNSGELTMQGGSVTADGSAVMVRTQSGVKAGTANIQDAKLTSTTAVGYGINLNSEGTSATIDNVEIVASGTSATGVWLPSLNSSFVARNFSIDSGRIGIDTRSGQVTLNDGSITTTGANGHALYASTEMGAGAAINAANVDVKTLGAGSVGALSRVAGSKISLTDSSITTEGQSAYGLYATGANASVTATGTSVKTSGAGATGVVVNNRATALLDNSQIRTSGADAYGLWSYVLGSGVSNTVQVKNGSVIETMDAAALVASGGDHNITLQNSSILARAGGAEENGIAIQTGSLTSGGVTYLTGQVNINAAASTLTGNVLADGGVLDMTLTDGSVLTGAAISRDGRINSLSLDGSSVWNVRGNSNLGTLNNAGTVSFVSPDAQAGFKTLTVNDYVGGGTLVVNTQLGDDASPTDKLVIDAGTTSGVTAMRVVNHGGVGGQTDQGIRLVETINGGTTTADAFRLDSGSTGYRNSSGTVAINGYDYSLIRGGNQGVEADWYLTSVYTPPTGGEVEKPEAPTPPENPENPLRPNDPLTPSDPLTPPVIDLPPDGPVYKNVSPESGAYVGNQLAASRMFMHGLHDREIARVPTAGSSAELSTLNTWARIQGGHDGKLRMSEGKVTVDTDRSIIQLGGDVVQGKLGDDGRIVAGVMAGYGDARVKSTSRLVVPGANQGVDANARGKVSGYSVGMYATAYGNTATGLGPYADAWMQYGRYSNQLSSELGTTRYHSNVWTTSIETGYAAKPFAPASALGAVVVVPQVQLSYTRSDAARASLQGMEMSNNSRNAVNTRVGVRVYPLGKSEAVSSVRPFLETNWLHSSDNPGVNIGSSTLSASPMRNAAELKLGAEGRIGKSLYLSGQVSGQAGSNDQRGVGGMLNINYRW